MLINEIGRFGDNVEDIKPMDLINEIPPSLHGGRIGIFWHLGDNKWVIKTAGLFSKEAVVEMGQDYDFEDNPDDLQIDLDVFHKDFWENVKSKNPELSDYKFDHFSRGRVLYEVKNAKFKIFIPDRLKSSVKDLAKWFNLNAGQFDVDTVIYKAKPDVNSVKDNKFSVEFIENS